MVGACEAVCLSHAAVQGRTAVPAWAMAMAVMPKEHVLDMGFSFLHANGVLSFSVVLFGSSGLARAQPFLLFMSTHFTQTRHNDLARVRYITVQSSSSPIALFSHPASSVIASPNKQHP